MTRILLLILGTVGAVGDVGAVTADTNPRPHVVYADDSPLSTIRFPVSMQISMVGQAPTLTAQPKASHESASIMLAGSDRTPGLD